MLLHGVLPFCACAWFACISVTPHSFVSFARAVWLALRSVRTANLLVVLLVAREAEPSLVCC